VGGEEKGNVERKFVKEAIAVRSVEALLCWISFGSSGNGSSGKGGGVGGSRSIKGHHQPY